MNDNAKGPAKSAGAQLRRYGEQALREDVQGILAEWAEEVQVSEEPRNGRLWDGAFEDVASLVNVTGFFFHAVISCHLFFCGVSFY